MSKEGHSRHNTNNRQEESMTKVCMVGCGKLGMPCAEVMAEKYDVVRV